jgi:hypothetical protein
VPAVELVVGVGLCDQPGLTNNLTMILCVLLLLHNVCSASHAPLFLLKTTLTERVEGAARRLQPQHYIVLHSRCMYRRTPHVRFAAASACRALPRERLAILGAMHAGCSFQEHLCCRSIQPHLFADGVDAFVEMNGTLAGETMICGPTASSWMRDMAGSDTLIAHRAVHLTIKDARLRHRRGMTQTRSYASGCSSSCAAHQLQAMFSTGHVLRISMTAALACYRHVQHHGSCCPTSSRLHSHRAHARVHRPRTRRGSSAGTGPAQPLRLSYLRGGPCSRTLELSCPYPRQHSGLRSHCCCRIIRPFPRPW